MSNLTVVYDACVLYPAPLRSFLMYLALTDIFQARWSADIHQEWMRSVAKDYPDIDQAKLEHVRDLMDLHVRDCLVTGYEDLVNGLDLPDPNDRHVLAAAIHCKANIIVTSNLKHFPEKTLSIYDIKAQHPDEFIVNLFYLSPTQVCNAANQQRESLKNPPMSPMEFLETLEKQGLTTTVAALRGCKHLI